MGCVESTEASIETIFENIYLFFLPRAPFLEFSRRLNVFKEQIPINYRNVFLFSELWKQKKDNTGSCCNISSEVKHVNTEGKCSLSIGSGPVVHPILPGQVKLFLSARRNKPNTFPAWYGYGWKLCLSCFFWLRYGHLQEILFPQTEKRFFAYWLCYIEKMSWSYLQGVVTEVKDFCHTKNLKLFHLRGLQGNFDEIHSMFCWIQKFRNSWTKLLQTSISRCTFGEIGKMKLRRHRDIHS